MRNIKRFSIWLKKRDFLEEVFSEAEVFPDDDADYNLVYNTNLKYVSEPQWVWMAIGKRLIKAYTEDDPRLYDKEAGKNHSYLYLNDQKYNYYLAYAIKDVDEKVKKDDFVAIFNKASKGTWVYESIKENSLGAVSKDNVKQYFNSVRNYDGITPPYQDKNIVFNKIRQIKNPKKLYYLAVAKNIANIKAGEPLAVVDFSDFESICENKEGVKIIINSSKLKLNEILEVLKYKNNKKIVSKSKEDIFNIFNKLNSKEEEKEEKNYNYYLASAINDVDENVKKDQLVVIFKKSPEDTWVYESLNSEKGTIYNNNVKNYFTIVRHPFGQIKDKKIIFDKITQIEDAEKLYYLGIVTKDKYLDGFDIGEALAIMKFSDSEFIIENKKGIKAILSLDTLNNFSEFSEDENNKKIVSKSKEDIFNKLNSKRKGKPKREDVRIPDEKMSEYNFKIQESFVETSDNMMIDALAGTGKTTMLKHLSSYIKDGEKWLYLVFNRINKQESENKFPEGVDVMTTHSYLGKLLENSEDKSVGSRMRLDYGEKKTKKIYEIADAIIDISWPKSKYNYQNKFDKDASPFNWKAKQFVIQLSDLAKAYAIDPMQEKEKIIEKFNEIIMIHSLNSDLSTSYKEQDKDEHEKHLSQMLDKSIELLKLSMPNVKFPKEYSSLKTSLERIRDDNDTLWFAAMNAEKINWNPYKYKVVLMDEVQDFNDCQIIMAQKLKESGARIVCVGDANQAIYLFRGSNAQAFEKLKKIAGDGNSHSLPINFRSGGNIINWVTNNTNVKDIQAAPHLENKGKVYAVGGTHEPIEYDTFIEGVVGELKGKEKKLTESTAIISRVNSSLASAAIYFLKNNVQFVIIGKDLSKELLGFIIKTKTSFEKRGGYRKNISGYQQFLNDYLFKKEDEWSGKATKKDELKDLKEMTETLTIVIDHIEETKMKDSEKKSMESKIQTVDQLMDYIKEKLGGLDPGNEKDFEKIKKVDNEKVITLTTAHRSKGLEWERVFLMKPELYTPKNENNKEEARQESNAFYVAATRAMKTLIVQKEEY
jgi:superfamily I DNA/RNA helicase